MKTALPSGFTRGVALLCFAGFMAQRFRPSGRATLATALPLEVAAAFQRAAEARKSTVSAELRRLVLADLSRTDDQTRQEEP
jgi:hypothetical protein